jgi:hypothetical protein
MATLQNLLRCHAIEFGYLSEPGSGEPLRGYGRHLVRSTSGYPEGCLPVATPARIAAHVAALPQAIDPAHDDPGALLISPSYERSSAGELRGAWLTVQRVRLFPDDDDAGMPGDAVRSNALIFSWDDFAFAAPSLGPALNGLCAEPVSINEPGETRIGRPRLSIVTGEPDAPATALVEAAAHAILGSVFQGARLRLDARWCLTEADFVAAYLLALGRLPLSMRAHVSAAAGVCAPDRGFQIVWGCNTSGLDPDGEAAANLIRLGERWRTLPTGGADGACIADDERFAADSGLVSATFKTPALHAHVRRELAAKFGEPADIHADNPSPVQAERLLREFAHQGPDRKTLQQNAQGASGLLRGLASTNCSLEEIDFAIELCDAADQPFESQQILRIRRLAGGLLAARLAASVCPSFDFLNTLTGRPGLAGTVAQEIGLGNERVIAPLRRILTAIARRDGPEALSLRRLAGPLLPRDHRVVTVWRGYRQDDGCLAKALLDVASGSQAIDGDSVGIMADALIGSGKWNLVRDALAQAVSRLGRADEGVLDNPDSQVHRLRLISALGNAMERACDASPATPSRRAG